MNADATYLIPDKVDYEHAAPIFCAGYTVYSGLHWADPKPHERVAVLGIGGLGHLAVQYAKAAGFETIAISHSPDKDEMTRSPGADEIVRDGKNLAATGGRRCNPQYSNSTRSMVDRIQGLRPDGRLVTIGADAEPLSISLMDLITRRIRIISKTAPNTFTKPWISSRKEKLRRSSRRTHWPRLERHTSASRRARPGSVPSSQCSPRR